MPKYLFAALFTWTLDRGDKHAGHGAAPDYYSCDLRTRRPLQVPERHDHHRVAADAPNNKLHEGKVGCDSAHAGEAVALLVQERAHQAGAGAQVRGHHREKVGDDGQRVLVLVGTPLAGFRERTLLPDCQGRHHARVENLVRETVAVQNDDVG